MKKENEYLVEVLINEKINLGTNIFAYSEDEAILKADNLIREKNLNFHNCTIDVLKVLKLNNQKNEFYY